MDEEEQTENLFEQEEGELKTTVMGTISHGVLWQENNTYCLTYEGGEMEIPYFMQGFEIARNGGLSILVPNMVDGGVVEYLK